MFGARGVPLSSPRGMTVMYLPKYPLLRHNHPVPLLLFYFLVVFVVVADAVVLLYGFLFITRNVIFTHACPVCHILLSYLLQGFGGRYAP